MKVLFAVKSESISDAIIRRYQKEYKEILSYKNVYYFNAILKEIQRDKSYDRIVISEDLEPFSNNNYDIIDKFIFEKLDNISDEAHNSEGKETSIIFICTERHSKGSSFLVKLFGIGIYNALLGSDRGMEQVCKLINQPRLKKEAKLYYKIDSDDVNYDPSSGKEVTEAEIQSILSHFRGIAREKEKFATSFDNIASQYTDDQLKIIINCLPIGVKAVLQEESQTYQSLMSTSAIQRVSAASNLENKELQRKTGIKIDILENKLSQPKMSGPIVIPSSVKKTGAKTPIKVNRVETAESEENTIPERKIVKKVDPTPKEPEEKEEINFDNDLSELDDVELNDDFMMDSFDEISETNNTLSKAKNDVEDISLTLDNEDDVEDILSTLDEEDDGEDILSTLDEEDDGEDILSTLDEDDDEEDILSTLDEEDDGEDILSTLDEDDDEVVDVQESKPITIKKGRGRPRKTPVETVEKPKGKRGRPRKNALDVEAEENLEDDLLDLGIEETYEEVQEDDDDLLLDYDDTDDSTLTMLESDESDDIDMLESLDNDDVLMSLDDEIDTEDVDDIELDDSEGELTLSEISDLDDIEDYEEDAVNGMDDVEEVADSEDDDILSAMDYEEINEDDYFISEMGQQDEDSLIMTLDENEEDDSEPEVKAEKNIKTVKSVKTVITPKKVEVTDFEEEPILNPNNNVNNMGTSSSIESIKPQVDYSMSTLNSLLTREKKVATFVGTTKNGTSFLVNNLAAFFSSMGINTAILDMTQNRNSYYIYTKNEEELRKIAYTSIEKLENGFAEGIKVDKNLTVYTALPNNGKKYTNAEPILSTLVQNHSVVLIDCDFETDPSYFASCQEIYLVQSMDILTIQPLTSFLRELKAKGVLESEKVRVVINKELKVRSLTIKMIIGGMSFYNDPAMSFMTELFNKDMVKACTIPFEIGIYSKYLDAMVNCDVSLGGYTKAFESKLKVLADMVYPLTGSKQAYGKPNDSYNKKAFSNNMNNTLNQMKNKF